MPLTPSQLATMKSDILANPDLNALPNTPDGAFAIADLYNAVASPDYWVWRTRLTQQEIVSTTTPESTTWSWTTYIGRSQGERDGWREMFSEGAVNFALANVRAAIADIFSGAGGANQRTHILTAARRKATRVEKLFAVGSGTTANPSTMAFEGAVTYQEVQTARNLP